jgi:hypothetical protein
MSHRCFFLLLLSSLACAQAAPSASQTKPAPAPPQATKPAAPPPVAPNVAKPPTPEVAPNTPVITLNGVCDVKAGAPKPADCKTQITKEQFERLVSALSGQPISQIPPEGRQQAAAKIAETMIVSREAEKAGIQNRADAQEVMRFARMSILATEYIQVLKDKYAHSSPAEIEKYYNDHKADFEEAHLKRVYIPKPRPEGDKPVDESAARATAEKIHQEAVAGGDFDKLQKEAFEAAHIKSPPPPTDLANARAANAPEAHKPVFALKPGEVSQLISDGGGFYLYKLESKQVVPLEKAKDEIEKSLQSEKMKKVADEISHSAKTELNPAYFGPGAAGPGANNPRPPQPPAPKPPVQSKPPAPPPKP